MKSEAWRFLSWDMPEISRLNVNSDWINLDFMKRERTPEQAMKLGIQMHVVGLSLSNTT